LKKEIILHPQAEKEISEFHEHVQERIYLMIKALEENGALEISDAKKLSGHKNLFEIRIRYLGQYRVLYTYYLNKFILILTAFQKKTQRTPSKIIKTAINREYYFK
jgi:phage-related protein